MINSTLSKPLPSYVDDENNTIFVDYSPKLSFIMLDGNNFIIFPTQYSDMGTYTINVTLNDT